MEGDTHDWLFMDIVMLQQLACPDVIHLKQQVFSSHLLHLSSQGGVTEQIQLNSHCTTSINTLNNSAF